MDKDASRFRVLLAEDDPVSRGFLNGAMRAAGADVAACGEGDAALRLARSQTWDLLVFDHRLPGRNGDAVLAALRADPGAASRAIPAVATSAARDAEMATLLRAGFAEVLPKPMPIEVLCATLHRYGCRAEPILDDEEALRACGSAAAVARLRRLFAEQELPGVQHELERIGDAPESLRPTLHRLQASCGFCGAKPLALATAALQRALAGDADPGRVQLALGDFRNALVETRASLKAAPQAADA